MKVVSVVGSKNSGKTTLISRLIPVLKRHGSVGVVKHIHSQFDSPGKDTEKFSSAGAEVVIAVTPEETVKIASGGDLFRAIDELSDAGIDFALIEGFKSSDIPKIAIGDVAAENILKRVDPDVDPEELLNLIFGLEDYFTLNSLILKARSGPNIDKVGAIGTFTGIVRGITGETVVKALDFEKYGGVAEERIGSIIDDLKEREGVVDVLIHHRSGYIETGSDIVYVVVAGSHRGDVFSALSLAIERVKEEVPIWKKEITIDGDYWVHDKMIGEDKVDR
ncbi:MAG: molybdopterin synthase [Halobacteriota archaeon]|nr:molybdopterin synthase [Halobacteriota archaeon]